MAEISLDSTLAKCRAANEDMNKGLGNESLIELAINDVLQMGGGKGVGVGDMNMLALGLERDCRIHPSDFNHRLASLSEWGLSVVFDAGRYYRRDDYAPKI